MTFEKYNHKPPKKKHYALIAFTIFIIVLAFLIFSSISKSNITGNAVSEELSEKGVSFNARLGVPSLNLKGSFSEIKIQGSDAIFIIEGKKFDTEKEIKIKMINFNGKIYFNDNKITKLQGEVETIFVNDVSVSPEKGELDIDIENEFYYSSLNIKDIQVNDLEYTTSGKIDLNNGKQIIRLDKEKIIINEFYGNLDIQTNTAVFNGEALDIDIEGNSIISIRN